LIHNNITDELSLFLLNFLLSTSKIEKRMTDIKVSKRITMFLALLGRSASIQSLNMLQKTKKLWNLNVSNFIPYLTSTELLKTKSVSSEKEIVSTGSDACKFWSLLSRYLTEPSIRKWTRTQIDIREKKMNNSFPNVRTSDTLCPHISRNWLQFSLQACTKNHT